MTEEDVIREIAQYDGVELDPKSNDNLAIYSYHDEIMAVVKKGSQPLVIALRCDPNLAKLLEDKYESVLPGLKLNRRRFISIIMTGQLSDDDIKAQIRHAYEETKKMVK